MISFKGQHTPKFIILHCIQWYCAYALSYRNIEEMMAERGIKIDHSTLNRWVVKYAPLLEEAFHKKKKKPGDRWRLDETYLKVKGQWQYYYRAVDKQGNTIDFLLTAKRDKNAGIKQFNKDNSRRIKIRQCKYLNNIVEQDHRNIKGITRQMLGFKNFNSAQNTLAGIELVAMLKKGQMKKNLSGALTPAEQFYALAA